MRRSAGRASILVAAFLGASCTWISTAKLEEKRSGIDEDEDGSPWSADCDDEDRDRSPTFDEVPYDGIDNDLSLIHI